MTHVYALRAATPADAPFVAELLAASLRPGLAATGLAPEAIEAVIAMQIASRDQDYGARFPEALDQVVMVEGEPVGRLLTASRPDHLRLIDVALVPGRRRRGLGTLLLVDLLAKTDAAVQDTSLSVLSSNPARLLYARLGYVELPGDGPHVSMHRPARAVADEQLPESMLRYEQVAPLVGRPASLAGVTPNATLVSAKYLAWNKGYAGLQRPPFSMVFRLDGPQRAQGIAEVELGGLGVVPLFLSCIGPADDGDAFLYESLQC